LIETISRRMERLVVLQEIAQYDLPALVARAEAAEALVGRLREAIQQAVNELHGDPYSELTHEMLRAALAESDAGSENDGRVS
jgi:hypothetical protein